MCMGPFATVYSAGIIAGATHHRVIFTRAALCDLVSTPSPYSLFFCLQNESKPVQMMHKKAKYNMTYIEEYRTKILEIPYIGNELSMIILLPDKIEDNSTGLEKVRHGMEW